MNPEQYRRAVEVFRAALDHEPEDQVAFARRTCGDDDVVCARVLQMLAEDGEEDGVFSETALGIASEVLGSALAGLASPGGDGTGDGADRADAGGAPVPERIGPYRVIRKLAEGGMGVVYEAEQSRPKRMVALKVIRENWFTPGLHRRFEHEVRVLGQLQHPGIAHVYDAGTVQMGDRPLPYFAMELVQGESLLDYANFRDLSQRRRLELMADVSDAVQHAHQKGVIHRDLKPGNIMVTEEGRTKVLDFGVARAIDADVQTLTLPTEAGQMIGTIPYMSPEQVRGNQSELDTRSDVYALGVVCFELLCGRLPYDLRKRSIPEAARIINDEDPMTLSSVDRQFRGDVETIVSKALAKRREERYESAADMAFDIRRHLRDEPIMARPPSAAYQLRKFAVRHKGLVAGLALAVTALVVGAGMATWQAIVATQARERSQANARKAAAVTDFLIREMLLAVTPDQRRGREITLFDVLQNASDRVEEALGDDPEVEAAVRHTLGEAYNGLGDYDAAEMHLRRALALREAALGSEHSDTLSTMAQLCRNLKRVGKLEEAAPLQERAYEILRDTRGADHVDTLDARNNLGTLRALQRRYEEAAQIHREVLAARQRICADDDPMPYYSMHNLAYALQSMGDLEAAGDYYRQAIEGKTRIEGDNHPSTLFSRIQLGDVLRDQGKLDEAESSCRATLAKCELVFGRTHNYVAHPLATLAAILMNRRGPGDLDEARELLERVIAIRADTLSADHLSVARGKAQLGRCMLLLGRYEDAEPLLVESHGAYASRSADRERVQEIAGWLVEVYVGLGREDAAEAYRRRLEQ